MPYFGIISGFGEGEEITGYILKLIKALRKRFRTKIEYELLPLGNYSEHGFELTKEIVAKMRTYDCIFAGDMKHRANPLDFSKEDIGISLDNNISYTCIKGIDKWANVDVKIASYFDGGFSLREGLRNTEGCTETRVCSTYSIMNIVKSVVRVCEDRRRRLSFIKDGDNEYCSDLFYLHFDNFTRPLSNFHLIKFNLRDIVTDIVYEPSRFDIIFASETFAKFSQGLYLAIMKEEYSSYVKYGEQKCVYSVDALSDNAATGSFTPSLLSYLTAFSDMLRDEFGMEKEAVALNKAVYETFKKNISPCDGDLFMNSVILELDKPLTGVYTKKKVNRRYIIK